MTPPLSFSELKLKLTPIPRPNPLHVFRFRFPHRSSRFSSCYQWWTFEGSWFSSSTQVWKYIFYWFYCCFNESCDNNKSSLPCQSLQFSPLLHPPRDAGSSSVFFSSPSWATASENIVPSAWWSLSWYGPRYHLNCWYLYLCWLRYFYAKPSFWQSFSAGNFSPPHRPQFWCISVWQESHLSIGDVLLSLFEVARVHPLNLYAFCGSEEFDSQSECSI